MKITNKFKAQLYNYFISRLGGYRYRRGWMRIPTCPYCGREHKLSLIHIYLEEMKNGVNVSGTATCDENGETYNPVSYTHLDVYKRQLQQGLVNAVQFRIPKTVFIVCDIFQGIRIGTRFRTLHILNQAVYLAQFFPVAFQCFGVIGDYSIRFVHPGERRYYNTAFHLCRTLSRQ